MPQLVEHGLTVFLGFFAIMNPIANTPIFLGLTADDPMDVRKRVARRALLTAFALIVVFTVLGTAILTLFGITLPAFRIMGGILVALIGYQMLHGEQSRVQQCSDRHLEASVSAALDVAVTPLAIPILAGPGTIATAMNFASTGGLPEMLLVIATFGMLCLITYASFVYGDRLVRYLGPACLGVITRIMGLILAVIGVQMLVDGIAGAIAGHRAA